MAPTSAGGTTGLLPICCAYAVCVRALRRVCAVRVRVLCARVRCARAYAVRGRVRRHVCCAVPVLCVCAGCARAHVVEVAAAAAAGPCQRVQRGNE